MLGSIKKFPEKLGFQDTKKESSQTSLPNYIPIFSKYPKPTRRYSTVEWTTYSSNLSCDTSGVGFIASLITNIGLFLYTIYSHKMTSDDQFFFDYVSVLILY